MFDTTRGAALPQTPLLALIRRESNALGFVVTVVVAVLVAAVIAVVIGEGAEGAEGAGCVINRMHNQQVLDRQNARLTGANNCSGSSGCRSSGCSSRMW